MTPPAFVSRWNLFAERLMAPLATPLLLGLRLHVAWQFLKSGWLKITDWDTTLFLFQEEYHVPLLPPDLAAVLGTTGEIAFPSLLIAGFMTRHAALGLLVVNVMAVVSYRQVLLSEGFEAALGQHYLWGTVLLVILTFGPGRWAIDTMLGRGR